MVEGAVAAARPGGSLAPSTSSRGEARRGQIAWWVVYATLLFVGVVIGYMNVGRAYQTYFGLGYGLLLALLATWVWAPRAALAFTVALALIGDIVTVAWFPFNKNLSSGESIMYFSDAVSFSPLEIVLAWALGVTVYRNLATLGKPLLGSSLVRPLLAFFGFVVFGLAYGLFRNGDMRIALIEARPLLYLPLMYLLVVNVCRTVRDYGLVFAAAVAGIFVQSVLSLHYLSGLAPAVRDELESLNEHGSAISMNLVFVLFLASLAYRRVPNLVRLALFVAAVPMFYVYLVAQRRAAIITLLLALIVIAVLMFWRQRTTFLRVVPIALLLLGGYLGAFWNSDSSAGFPAQAVKSVVVTEDANESDSTSNQYRDIENYNLIFTIKTSPLMGLGFGHAFYRPIPLADISFFENYLYFSHNSFLWVWIQMGFGGFVAMIYLFARTLMAGAARARAAPVGMPALWCAGALTFVLMFGAYVFVDIAWEPRNVVLLAVAMALCTAPIVELDRPGSAGSGVHETQGREGAAGHEVVEHERVG